MRLGVLKKLQTWWWMIPVAVAVWELSAIAYQSNIRISDRDWKRVERVVAPKQKGEDLILTQTRWIEPFLLRELGAKMPLTVAGFSDTAPFSRVWQIGLDEEAPLFKQKPNTAEQFGRLSVRTWDLGKPTVVFDFVSEIEHATVQLLETTPPKDCRLQRTRSPQAGGVLRGAAMPYGKRVHHCDSQRPWLWVGPTVVEDLDQRARRCIWHHPAGPAPIRVTYPNVPRGDRLVFYGGLYYDHERVGGGAPVEMTVWIDGKPLGQMQHRAGDGWKRMEVATGFDASASSGEGTSTMRVEIDVTSEAPHYRTFCWNGNVRSGRRPREFRR